MTQPIVIIIQRPFRSLLNRLDHFLLHKNKNGYEKTNTSTRNKVWSTKICSVNSTSVSQKFYNISVRVSLQREYHLTKAVQAVIGRIVVVGALTCCSLVQGVCNLKATQMNVQRSLNREPTLYDFELGYNFMKATKNIWCAKGESIIDHNTVTR